MEPVMVQFDKDDTALTAIIESNSNAFAAKTPLAAEIGLAVAALTTAASAINVATAAMNSRLARSTNLIKINGRKYELTFENRDKIVAAIDEHFGT